MKCPTCVKEGERSTVYAPMGGVTTDMGWQDYWDEEGVYHSHNPNGTAEEYSCSRRHRWAIGSQTACPAGDYPGYHRVTLLPDLPKPAPYHLISKNEDGQWTDTLVVSD